MPATSMLSLTANGVPASGRCSPACRRRSTAAAAASASSASMTSIQMPLRPSASMRSSAPATGGRGRPTAPTDDGPHDPPSAASRADDGATAPNTPPCIVTIFSAAS